MAKKSGIVKREVPEDRKGPTQVTKGVERPDRTEPQKEADARRRAWEKAHAKG